MVQGIPTTRPKAGPTAARSPRSCTGVAYATSAEMAAEVGPFPRYEPNRDDDAARHPQPPPRRVQRPAATTTKARRVPVPHRPRVTARPDLLAAARDASRTACSNSARSTAIRNAQVTVIAPTGTIGLVMDCDTTGIEPDFALVKFKKLAGGGYFKIINQRRAAGPAHARLSPSGRSTTSSATAAVGHGSLRLPAHQPRDPEAPRASPTTVLDEARSGAAGRVRAAVRRSTAGRSATTSSRRRCKRRPRSCIEAAGFDLLAHLGFTQEADRRRPTTYVCGTMTIEGAPHLKAEHYPVFDCANKCGKLGKRFLSRRDRTSA